MAQKIKDPATSGQTSPPGMLAALIILLVVLVMGALFFGYMAFRRRQNIKSGQSTGQQQARYTGISC